MGIVTTTSETAFRQSPEELYAFVSNPANWALTYPGSTHIRGLPDHFPLKVGDTWTEAGADADRIFTWQLAIAMPPRLFVFTSVGRLGHDSKSEGGFEARITVQCQFLRLGNDVTVFSRTMTIEAYKDTPLPDDFFRPVNPANIDKYHAVIGKALHAAGASAG